MILWLHTLKNTRLTNLYHTKNELEPRFLNFKSKVCFGSMISNILNHYFIVISRDIWHSYLLNGGKRYYTKNKCKWWKNVSHFLPNCLLHVKMIHTNLRDTTWRLIFKIYSMTKVQINIFFPYLGRDLTIRL